MRFPGFIGPSYTLQSVNADAQRCLNLYPEMNEIGTEKEQEVAALVGTPGLRLLAAMGLGPIRGVYTSSLGGLYVASGNTLYSVDSSWTATSLGPLLTSSGPVSMADNGLQMVCVDGPNGYYVTIGQGLIIQTDTLTVNTATDAHVYTGLINAEPWTYTAGPSDTPSTIATAIAAAINAISGVAVLAVASGPVVTITALIPGTPFTDTTTDALLAIASTTSNFSQITDPNFLGADQVTFQDGYLIFNKPGTEEFYLSGLNAITFDALDIGTAEGLPDNLTGLISDQRNLYLFGSLSTEIFYDSGNTFPFERIQGAFIPVGCTAAFTVANLQQAVYFLGQDKDGRGIVYRIQGYQAERISTHALEKVIAGISANSLSSSRAWTYVQGGHGFYCLTFPGGESTWVFDTATSLWHERAYLSLGDTFRHRADCHAFAYNTNVVGDYQNGNIYALDPTVYSDNGAAILRMRAAPHITKGLNRVFHSRFTLDMETGVGLDGIAQGTDPQAILDWSDDGGHTWSNEKQKSFGKIGKTKARVVFNRLGASRDRVYRVKITDPVKVTLLGADLMLEEGDS